MQLRMHQELVKMGLDIKAPQLRLKTKAPQIEMRTEPLKIDMEQPLPRVQIDQTQCWADRGLRNLSDFAAYSVEISWEAFRKNLDERVAQGNRVAAMDGTTIADLVAESTGEGAEINVAAVPSRRPRMEWLTSPVKYQVERGKVHLELNRGRVENSSQMGYVKLYIRQPNSLSIDWVEEGRSWVG